MPAINDGIDVASVLDSPEARQDAMAQAEGINATYSLAGADMSKAEAAQAGIVTLSDWDLAEYQKYSGQPKEEILAALQQGANQAAQDRVRRLEQDQANRADIIGGLAIRGLIDVNEGTDLDDLPDNIKLGLPWHLRFTGPAGNGVTVVRKRWTEEEAILAAKVGGWDVHTQPARMWDADTGTWHTEDSLRTIVRKPVPAYAETCKCDGHHPGRDRASIELDDGTVVDKPLCAWLRPAGLGICRTGWKADVQVEDWIDVLRAFTETGQVELETIGWLQGGSRVFMQMRLADTRYLLGQDPWTVYLGIHVNYTGSGSNTIHTSGVRDLCDNTRKWSERTATGLARIRHTGNMTKRMVEAGEFILAAQGYLTAEQKIAEELAAIELTMADYRTIAEAIYEPTGVKTDRAASELEERRSIFVGHLLTDETMPEDLRRTGYGAREATNRWFGQMNPTLDRSDTARLNSVWDKTGTALGATRKVQKIVQTIGGKRVKETVRRRTA